MTRTELKRSAKEQIQGKIGTLFVMSLIVFMILTACAIILVIGSIATFIVVPAFSLSFCMIYLKLTKNEEIMIGDLFLGFSATGKAVWLKIITSFFIFLWSCLFVIPGIIKQYSYAMGFYILAENPELTAREALARSKEIMRGHKMELFILQLSFIGWYFLVGITFGLASIYVAPYINATTANFYNTIK